MRVITSWVFSSVVSICLFTASVFAIGGDMGVGTEPLTDGSETYPYLIEDLDDFDEFAGDPNYWASEVHTQLMTDVDLSGRTYTTAVIAQDTDNSNRTFEGITFTGHFDGNFCAIRELTIDAGITGNDYLGLFGYNQGVIENLTVEDVLITSHSDAISTYVGGLIGYNHNGIITNCSANSTIDTSAPSIYSSYTGGLIGYHRGGTISECHTTGSVVAFRYVGGLIGYLREGDIEALLTQCYSNSSVEATGTSNYFCYAGGLVGENSGIISDCYATGLVETVGYFSGGLVGLNDGIIKNCYSTGKVLGGEPTGGLIGYDLYSSVINCFWDVQASEQAASSGGGLGKTTIQMKQAETYLGWNSDDQISWKIDEDNDYPSLVWESKPGISMSPSSISDFLEGEGSSVNPYQISTLEQIILVGRFTNELDKSFILTENIDLAGYTESDLTLLGQSPTTPFTGVFNGNGFVISNLSLNLPMMASVGLFRYVDGANISNLNLENVNISGGHSVGGMIGHSTDAAIVNCDVSGSVFSSIGAGGLAGDNNGGTLQNCHTNISVDSTGSSNRSTSVGGLIGSNSDGTIMDCHAIGTVTIASNTCSSYTGVSVSAGGLIGHNNRDTMIINCSATGNVTAFHACESAVAGGLIGKTYEAQTTIISTCYANSAVIASGNENAYAGGFMGRNDRCSVKNCYSIESSVVVQDSGNAYLGGFIGETYRGGGIFKCYTTNPVNVMNSGSVNLGGFAGDEYLTTLSHCYFLNQTGTDNGYGSPLDDPNMMIQSNFTDWDFLGESNNGQNDIWRMCIDGVDYPRLSWEFAQNGDFACGDGTDILDLLALAEHWLLTEELNPDTFNYSCDANGDGIINLLDYSVFGSNW